MPSNIANSMRTVVVHSAVTKAIAKSGRLSIHNCFHPRMSSNEARNGSHTNFNHNSKYLERAETAEIMLEPLLNGNEIMEYTALPPGPMVGMLRDNLLKAQIAGEVTDRDSAIEFVRKFKG